MVPLRMTLSEETTMEDADFVVDKLKEIVPSWQSMSPLYEDFIKTVTVQYLPQMLSDSYEDFLSVNFKKTPPKKCLLNS